MGLLTTIVNRIRKVTSGRILGRVAVGTGRAEQLTAAQVLAFLSVYTTSQVDAADGLRVPYAGATGGVNLGSQTFVTTGTVGGGQITGTSFRVASGALETYSGSTRLTYSSTVFTNIDSGRVDIINGGVGIVNFGGTSSSYCRLMNSGNTLKVRLADNSADAPVTAGVGAFSGNLSSTGNISAGSYFIGSTYYMSGFDCFAAKGGTGASSTYDICTQTTMRVRNYAGSADAGMSCAAITLSGAANLAQKTIGTLPSAAASNGQRYMVIDSAVQGGRIAYCYGSVWRYEDGSAV